MSRSKTPSRACAARFRARADQCRRAMGARCSRQVGVNARANVRLVQGSHIVVPKLYDHDRAYILQNSDGRIVFTIPYQGDYTLIGTTDRDYDGDPAAAKATQEEIDYLCASVSEYLAKPVRPADVVWTYSGVRPLYDDGASEAKAATRDYVFEVDPRPARRRYSLCSVARSRPIAGSRKKHWSASRRGCLRSTARAAGPRCTAARRRLRRARRRCADRFVAIGLSVSVEGPCQPAGARLRYARQKAVGRRIDIGRSRRRFRRDAD